VDDRTYRRMFQETPRQQMIRHNWPALCWKMTKAERRNHVDGLRAKAESLRRAGDRIGAETIENHADAFERAYPWKGRVRR
jgi:hypothetical protein